MKHGFFTLLFTCLIAVSYSQTTYYWVGGAGPVSFTANSSWNTNLDGSGTTRAASAADDILVIDGTNIGGSSPATGPIEATVSSTAMGKLLLQNGADIAFKRTSSGTATITIGDDPSGDDLMVFAGCKLRFRGTTGSVLVVLKNNAGSNNAPPATTSATALIQGDIIMEEATSSSTAQNRFTSRKKNAVVFAAGSSITTKADYLYYPFGSAGSSTTPVADGVVFEAGASFYFEGGLSPFGSNSTSTHVDFQPGSNFYFKAANATNMFSNRKYGNVFIQNNTTVTADGSLIKVENLTIDAGSTFITNTSGATPVNGDIVNNGVYMIPAANPDRNNKLVMINAAAQTLGGNGTYSLGDFIISNISNVSLNKSLMVDSSTVVIGILTPNGFDITGAGTTTVKSPASIPVTGNINIDSFLVKNIADFTGIEVGMSVTGAGIPANTVITNTSTASGTITLSKAATTGAYAGAAVSLTIFNGAGVLPTYYTNVSAALHNDAVKVNWSATNQNNIISYIIERNTGGNQFTEIGKLAANQAGHYSFVDAKPMNGINLYRVKAVSANGSVQISSIVKVTVGKSFTLELFPNPASTVLSIAGLEGSNKIRILDMNGRIVLQSQTSAGTTSTNINVADLTRGNYLLEITGQSGKKSRSFIKL